MKISFVLPTYSRKLSGGKKIIYEYANFLANNGHDVTLYYPYENYKGKIKKIPAPQFIKELVFKYVAKYDRITWFNLNENIKRKGVIVVDDKNILDGDAIVATAVETACLVMRLTSSKGHKFYFIQDYETWNMDEKEVDATFGYGMTSIVISKWLKRIVDSKSKEESILIPDGIDTTVFKVEEGDRIPHSIVFHYRKSAHKGSEYAFEAIRRLEKKYADLKVFCISREEKPNDLPMSCQYLHNLKPKEVAEINNKAQIFMCSSIDEGFGLPGLEAMACGCAVVSTSYTGVLEYAQDKYNAYLSKPKDVEQMVNNIEFLFNNNDIRDMISRNGIETVEGFSFLKSAQLFEKNLEKRCH